MLVLCAALSLQVSALMRHDFWEHCESWYCSNTQTSCGALVVAPLQTCALCVHAFGSLSASVMFCKISLHWLKELPEMLFGVGDVEDPSRYDCSSLTGLGKSQQPSRTHPVNATRPSQNR